MQFEIKSLSRLTGDNPVDVSYSPSQEESWCVYVIIEGKTHKYSGSTFYDALNYAISSISSE